MQRKGAKRKRERVSGSIRNVIYFWIVLLYMELVVHVGCFGFSGLSFLYILLFTLPASGALGLLTNFGRKRQNYLITCALTLILSLVYCYQVLKFCGILKSIFLCVLLMLPVAATLFVSPSVVDYRRKFPAVDLVLAFFVAVTYALSLVILIPGGRELDSAYVLYHEGGTEAAVTERLGVLTKVRLGLAGKVDPEGTAGSVLPSQTVLEGEGAQSASQEETALPENGEDSNPSPESDGEYNLLSLDFDSLIEGEEDAQVKALHEYFSLLSPTKKNEYTGKYQGYNLIFINAEGFSPYVIDQERTPVLYRLATEGFVFENFYTPVYDTSSSAGEWTNLTGLIPTSSQEGSSLRRSGEKQLDLCFTLGEQLSQQGYRTLACYNYSYLYDGRDQSYPNMGYEWIASGNGFEPELDAESGLALWPQSDLKMVNDTFEKYCDQEPFHVTYVTNSGHVNYSFEKNAMSARNRQSVSDLAYSDEAKAYLAAQQELEKAVSSLIDMLEEKKILNHTLIVIAPSHVPYESEAMLEELAGKELDDFEYYKNSLIVWAADMEEPVTVNKVCGSVDILPTISNLLGLDFDSRMLAGRDILSDSEGLVIFRDGSFITDSSTYNAVSRQLESTAAELDENYLTRMRKTVKYRMDLTDQIIDTDYYSHIVSGQS